MLGAARIFRTEAPGQKAAVPTHVDEVDRRIMRIKMNSTNESILPQMAPGQLKIIGLVRVVRTNIEPAKVVVRKCQEV